jgi:hypothetical protein
MEININDLKVDKNYELTQTSFVYASGTSPIVIKLNAFGCPKINYMSSDYILCITADKWCFIILNSGEINDKY